jgi:hypothetical protein
VETALSSLTGCADAVLDRQAKEITREALVYEC